MGTGSIIYIGGILWLVRGEVGKTEPASVLWDLFRPRGHYPIRAKRSFITESDTTIGGSLSFVFR